MVEKRRVEGGGYRDLICAVMATACLAQRCNMMSICVNKELIDCFSLKVAKCIMSNWFIDKTVCSNMLMFKSQHAQ